MAIQQRFCIHHPDRPAIGICVITKAAICGECSTRYEGVNYSKEGLEILHRQRKAAAPRGGRVWPILAWLMLPGLVYLVYLGYWLTVVTVINLIHPEY
jgi:hypothetical protein